MVVTPVYTRIQRINFAIVWREIIDVYDMDAATPENGMCGEMVVRAVTFPLVAVISVQRTVFWVSSWLWSS